METTAKGWHVLDRENAILWRQYSFGPGVATTFVFRGAGDNLIVVSPGPDVKPDELDELKDFGNVTALVASNGFHWLGQPLYRKHFPGSRTFSPAQGVARLKKKLPGLSVETLDDIGSLVGDRATVVDAPAHKVGNAFAMVKGSNGTYWYPSDLLANIPELPTNFIVRKLMTMTSSAPGYRLFRPAVWLQVKSKPALRSWIDEELARASPTTIVPAHGAPVSGADVIANTKALLDTM